MNPWRLLPDGQPASPKRLSVTGAAGDTGAAVAIAAARMSVYWRSGTGEIRR
jgi:hypothetical protein